MFLIKISDVPMNR